MGAIEKAIARFNEASNPEVDQTGSQQVETSAAQIAAAKMTPAEAPTRRSAPAVTTPAAAATEVANPAVKLVKGNGFRAEGEDTRGNKRFALPYKAMELEGLLSLTAPRNQMSEEYRAIKRPVLAAIDAQNQAENYNDTSANRNVVMVTSCVSGEGKTFSAINLALSIALERDREVLLIDGDITNPSCGKRLGFDDQPGLTELLQNNERDPEELIWQSDLENFRFLPAGLSNNHATELLSSRNMFTLVKELSQDHPERVIIFDSAPLLLTSEASIVADLAGQIVFVVSAESVSYTHLTLPTTPYV